MANILFKRGSSENLPQKNAATDGVFYLTTDTHRLYVGQGTELVDLNKYVLVYDKVADMPNTANLDDFAYATAENVFAVFTSNGWKQVNPDSYVSAATIEIGATSDKSTSLDLSVKDNNHIAQTDTISILGGDNIHFLNENEALKISADNTTYDLTVVNGDNADEVKIKLINSETPNIPDVINLKGEGKVNVALNDNNIVITGAKTGMSTISAEFDNSGQLTIGAKTIDDAVEKTAEIMPIVKYGDTPVEAKFINGTATLDIYTAQEIDSLIDKKIAIADAMTFKGVVSKGDAAEKLNSSNANVGDTYKAAEDITTPVIANTGDLIIAEGTDQAVDWVVIPSGDDQVIKGNASGTSMTISDGGIYPLTGITINSDGTDITTEAQITATGEVTNNVNTITLKHGAAGTGTAIEYAEPLLGETIQSAKNEIIIPAITEIKKDDNGHISTIVGKQYKIVDTHNSITDFKAETTTNSNISTITLSVKDADAATAKTTDFSIGSSNLTVSNVNNAIAINLDWGTF